MFIREKLLNTRKMLRILFFVIVCEIHVFGFIEGLNSKGKFRTQREVLRQPNNAPGADLRAAR